MIRPYILSAARTPIGKFHGGLASVSAPRLGVVAAQAAVQRAGLQKRDIEEVYMGEVLQAGVGGSPARQVVMHGGFEPTTDATTVNKVCSSGLKAVMLAAQNIQTAQRDLMLAGGMENMSQVPYYLPRTHGYGHLTALDGILYDGLTDVYEKFHMGNCAENTARKMGISRAEQDAFAIESYRRAAAAWDAGAFDAEVVPVTVSGRKGDVLVGRDEEYTAIKLEKVPSLRPAFDKNGTVTAANASSINDGAAALVVASEDRARQLGGKAMARIVSFADAAMAPIDFPLAPSEAIPRALAKAGLAVKDIAKFEINEAFAAVIVANQRLLDLDPEKVNVKGGAVALGHPIGCSGARILVTLLHTLAPGEFGVAGICNAGGAASAMVVQRLDRVE